MACNTLPYKIAALRDAHQVGASQEAQVAIGSRSSRFSPGSPINPWQPN